MARVTLRSCARGCMLGCPTATLSGTPQRQHRLATRDERYRLHEQRHVHACPHQRLGRQHDDACSTDAARRSLGCRLLHDPQRLVRRLPHHWVRTFRPLGDRTTDFRVVIHNLAEAFKGNELACGIGTGEFT